MQTRLHRPPHLPLRRPCFAAQDGLDDSLDQVRCRLCCHLLVCPDTACFDSGIFMVGGTILGIATSWYLYRLTMRYVSETTDIPEEDLEAGLLDDVDELLASAGGSAVASDAEAEERAKEQKRTGTAEGRLVEPGEDDAVVRKAAVIQPGRPSADNWDGSDNFSDFDERAEAGRIVAGVEANGHDRRESVAWGLDAELDLMGDEEEQVKKRLD